MKKIINNEIEQWLKENITKYSTLEFTQKFNEKYGLNYTPHRLLCYCNRYGIKKGFHHKTSNYTLEQQQWLKKHYYELSKSQLAEEYNKTFNTNIKWNTLICYCTRYLNVNKKDYKIRKNIIFYDKEKIKWIKENYPKYLFRKDLTKEFNKRFNTNLKSLGGIIARLGLKGKDQKLKARMIHNNCITGDEFQQKAEEYFKLELEIEGMIGYD